MSDFQTASQEFEASEAEKGNTPETPAQQPVQQETESVEHSFESLDDAVAELKKVRQEAAERRVALKPYEETFGVYSDDDRQVWFQLASLLAQDQKQGAEAMKELAEALLGEESTNTNDEGETVSNQEKGAAEQAAEAAEALTPEKVQELIKESLTEFDQAKTQQQTQQQQLQELRSQAKELGYEPESPDYVTLLHYAHKETNGDLKEAHEKVQEWKSSVVEGFTKSKSEKAERTARTPEGAGTTPTPEAPEPITDFKTAKERMVQYLNDQAQAASQGG